MSHMSSGSALGSMLPTPNWMRLFPISFGGLVGVLGSHSTLLGDCATKVGPPYNPCSDESKTRMRGGGPEPRFSETVGSCNVEGW